MRNARAEEQPEGAAAAGDGYWFTPLPVYLTEAVYNPDSPVNAPAAMLWAHIHRNYAWRRRVFPSYATLAEETDQSESAVKRQMAALRQAGAITWGATYSAKGRSSNEYALAPVRPFEFDRATAAPVEVKNDPHPPVEVKSDPGVGVKNDTDPQVKNDLGVKNTEEVRAPLSPRVPKPTAPEPPAAPNSERETTATPDKPTAAQRAVRATQAVAPEDEAAFIAWLTTTYTPRGPGWWRTATGDLPELAHTWRQQQTPAHAGRSALRDWCGQCNRGEQPTSAAQRYIELPDGRDVKCPQCHPGAIGAAA